MQKDALIFFKNGSSRILFLSMKKNHKYLGKNEGDHKEADTEAWVLFEPERLWDHMYATCKIADVK